ncbi:uncharacterized protein LOC124203933 [Daphnia pulex]|uniref:uncharacterized protein LOC124203933 n=1 Tax=Daphnia pulex TaxID=6669 RepID=UPI001EDE1AD6|nr:uncharacterized protein LOC124203933 [Daphnia pulex]
MVNILEAVKGATLNYGKSSMEVDRDFKNWVATSPLSVPASQGEGTNWGKFLMISSVHQELAKNVSIMKRVDGDFEEFVRALKQDRQRKWSHIQWLETSAKMTELGMLLSQPEYQKLLGLALSTTFGKPLRYCIQHEIVPAASYWTYYADQLESCPVTQIGNNIAVVIVGSSNPVLSVSRAIAPLVSRGMPIVLVPENDLLAIPCLLMGEFLNKVGLDCSVYAGSSERLKGITSSEGIDIIVCGSYDQALALRDGASNLKLDLDGKKAVVVLETGDCDAAVDAALTALKTSSFNSCGLYLIVQDSMLEEIDWRLRERFNASRSGELLDKTIDFTEDSCYQAPSKVTDYLQGTKLDILNVGNARVIFNAQPSMPITQWGILGQTMLVFSYRSAAELLNVLTNLTGMSEISLWCEQQSIAMHIINQFKVPRIWVNGFASYEPGFDHLLPVKDSKLNNVSSFGDGKPNATLLPILDSLRLTQRSWAGQGNRNVLVTKFLKQLLTQEPLITKTDLLLELITAISRDTGKVATSAAKRGVIFDLADPVGVIALIASDSDRLDSLIRIITFALLKGNAIMLLNVHSTSAIAMNLLKIAKEVGLPNVLITCPWNQENCRALLNHHGTRMIVTCGDETLPTKPGNHVKRILELDTNNESCNQIIDNVVVRKWVWMATGEGLAN